jgi:hypothetical protein
MLEFKNGWIRTRAEFLSGDEPNYEELGIKVDQTGDIEPFCFRLDKLEAYNRGTSGRTTVEVNGMRTTIEPTYEEFDNFILSLNNTTEKVGGWYTAKQL